MKVVIGVDPGFSGAIAALSRDGDKVSLLGIYDTPVVKVRGKNQINVPMLNNWIRELTVFGNSEAVIEQVSAMPGQGVSSMFRFGMSYGILQGLMWANDVPVSFVTPPYWKKFHGLLGTDKDASRLKASELFPRHSGMFARKKDVGRADAVLIGMTK